MAMNSGADEHAEDERLACGRLLSEVWEAGEGGADDPHLRVCAHCSAAVRQLDLLGAAVRGASGDGREPEWDAGALTERVMDVVRLELRPGRPLPLGEREEDLWVREAMAAKALRAAAETVPGVRAGSCRIRPAESGGSPSRAPSGCGWRSSYRSRRDCATSRRRCGGGCAGRGTTPLGCRWTMWTCTSPA
ncbi:hypothetical protein ABZY14_13770 [Streptomyces sp. NPDC006617]|uniref:hypothetical protein n=1 Tax=Streptomyces sp. NPDC006617 TaxID=3155354 RepID=UPI0033BA2EE6